MPQKDDIMTETDIRFVAFLVITGLVSIIVILFIFVSKSTESSEFNDPAIGVPYTYAYQHHLTCTVDGELIHEYYLYEYSNTDDSLVHNFEIRTEDRFGDKSDRYTITFKQADNMVCKLSTNHSIGITSLTHVSNQLINQE